MADAQQDKRSTRRFALHLPVSVTYTEDGEKQKAAETRDVSARGISFYVDAPIAMDSPIEFTLTLPPEITLTESIKVRCKGRVVRSTRRLPTGRWPWPPSSTNTSSCPRPRLPTRRKPRMASVEKISRRTSFNRRPPLQERHISSGRARLPQTSCRRLSSSVMAMFRSPALSHEKQLRETQALLMSLSDDSLMKPFRGMIGSPHPAKTWADGTVTIRTMTGIRSMRVRAFGDFWQWVSALARMYAINRSPEVRRSLAPESSVRENHRWQVLYEQSLPGVLLRQAAAGIDRFAPSGQRSRRVQDS